MGFSALMLVAVLAVLPMGMSGEMLIFLVVTFILFIHSGITMEIHAHYAEHDNDGHG